MNNSNVKLDMYNLKKLAPVCLGIGMALLPVAGFLWGIPVLVAWAVCGGLYANAILKSGSKGEYVDVALNGAILAAISGLAFDILSGINFIIEEGIYTALISVPTFLAAGIMGAIGAVAWYAYKTNQKKQRFPRLP